jgi:hypothetical protein
MAGNRTVRFGQAQHRNLCTLITVGGGFAVIYIFFSWACGSDSSAC